MIALDTSALFAVAAGEPMADRCTAALKAHRSKTVMSAVTYSECLIVSGGRGLEGAMLEVLEEVGPEILPVDRSASVRVAAVYRLWGKGYHPARLNFCDCFAYLVAKERGVPLLFIGDDFSQTDIRSAL